MSLETWRTISDLGVVFARGCCCDEYSRAGNCMCSDCIDEFLNVDIPNIAHECVIDVECVFEMLYACWVCLPPKGVERMCFEFL